MDMYFRQRLFSWLDAYDIYDLNGNTIYTVTSQLSWGHCLHILDAAGSHVGTVQEKILTFLPKFEIYDQQTLTGMIYRNFTFFRPSYTIDFNGWQINGDVMTWNYTVIDRENHLIAQIQKDLWHMTDCYCIHVEEDQNALLVLMIALAIDADKCSHSRAQ